MNIKPINISKINNNVWEDTSDVVVVEMPLKLYINFELYTILMCTPNELKELAVGYLFSEGIITSINCIISIEEKFGDRVCIVLRDDIKVNYDTVKAEASGCGNASIQIKFIEQGWDKVIDNDYKLKAEAILKFMKEFSIRSEIFKQTGGVHSCAICGNEGIIAFSEDIGRHNALDKVIGKVMINKISIKEKFVMTTGRISSDIVVKTAKAGIPILVSHSAPTDLALSIAEAANLTVIGFVRGNRLSIFCGSDRIHK